MRRVPEQACHLQPSIHGSVEISKIHFCPRDHHGGWRGLWRLTTGRSIDRPIPVNMNQHIIDSHRYKKHIIFIIGAIFDYLLAFR